MVKVILFDFFGVLSTPVYKIVIEKFIPINEHPEWMKKLDVMDIGDMTEEELVKEISEKSNTEEKIIWEEINNAPIVNNKLFDFIQNSLKTKYKIGLLTNIPKSLLIRIVPEKMELFDIVMISSELKLIKPSKEIFEVAIEKCGCLPNEILFVDDREENIDTAVSLGLNGIVYKSFEQIQEDIQLL